MAQADVIKEFLVQLGFKTDEKSLKNFQTGIDNATKSVVKLVAAISGAALTVGAGVAAFASNLESLYYAAQRTGSSASSLKAFEKAAANFGASAGEALSSVESLARFMREKPGSEGYLASLGVQARDANGNLRDTVDIMIDLGKELAKKPYPVAKQYADFLGLSDNTFRALINGDFAREIERQRAALKDSGYEKATKDAHEFMIALRDLATQFEILGTKIAQKVLANFGMDVKKFGDWMTAHGDDIANGLTRIVELLLKLAEMTWPALKWLAETLIDLDKKTDGWSTKILVAVAALNLLGAASLIGGIASLTGGLLRLGAAVVGLGTAASGGGMAALMGILGRIGGGAALLLHSGELNSGEDEEMRRIHSKQGVKQTGSKQALYNAFRRAGWTHEAAVGLVANLDRESKLDPNAVGDSGLAYGIAQWHPDRQAAFKKRYGKDIRESTLAEQADFVTYELSQGARKKVGPMLQAAKNSRQAAEIVSRYYESPKDREGEAKLRGDAAVKLEQTTIINVNGAGDPGAVGNAVAGQQNRVNQDLTRNLQTNVQ